ncbi:MAG TPA: hypothetical protein PKL06_08680, partial [Chitinophagales bacterium]|nr:hypothetical protein [Chitinophagales bacterium]
MSTFTDTLLERDLIPDFLIRSRIRSLLRKRLADERKPTAAQQQQHLMDLVADLRKAPIAIATAEANEQHYEVPTAFFRYVM